MSGLILEQPVVWYQALSVLLIVFLAACSDVLYRRIPNRLVATGLLLAWLSQCWQSGLLDGSLSWLTGFAIGMAVLMPGYLLRMMGAGDVKLLGAVGAFFGAVGACQIGLASCVFGGLVAIAMMFHRRQLRSRLHRARSYLFMAAVQSYGLAMGVRLGLGDASKTGIAAADRMPFAVAIALGSTCVLAASSFGYSN